VVRKILDMAEYWERVTVTRVDRIVVKDRMPDEPYVTALISGREEQPLCRIVFRTVSHDQGHSNESEGQGTYRWSHTWFEAGGVQQLCIAPRHVIQYNVQASAIQRYHCIDWNTQDNSSLHAAWMKQFNPGDKLFVFPKAQYPGWENCVYFVRVELYYAWK